jgi:hypothetical protein
MLTKKQRLEWFKEELKRIREKAWHIPGSAPSRQDRPYKKPFAWMGTKHER